mmetsp:Transcript_8544/g.13195  ORF Transcript_8544/g.13195 Transcript_8544/m.13195 type:complete len:93 (-) Transcript_8544:2557-2835(-)
MVTRNDQTLQSVDTRQAMSIKEMDPGTSAESGARQEATFIQQQSFGTGSNVPIMNRQSYWAQKESIAEYFPESSGAKQGASSSNFNSKSSPS